MRLLDEAVLRILEVKRDLGLFADPTGRHDTRARPRPCSRPAHRAEARRIAERAIVLLENEGNVLPLARAPAASR
jgi:beta-glucosidase